MGLLTWGAFGGPGRVQARARVGPWWDPCGEGLPVVAAYRALGAESEAAARVNVAQPGTYDLTPKDGLYTPHWEAARGWYRSDNNQGWNTGITAATSNWTFVARSSGAWDCGFVFGADPTGDHDRLVGLAPYYDWRGGTAMFCNAGWGYDFAGGLPTGVVAMAGPRCYLGGRYTLTLEDYVPDWAYQVPIYLMCFNHQNQAGEGHNPAWFDIYSFSCYAGTLTDAQVRAVCAGHAGLTG